MPRSDVDKARSEALLSRNKSLALLSPKTGNKSGLLKAAVAALLGFIFIWNGWRPAALLRLNRNAFELWRLPGAVAGQ